MGLFGFVNEDLFDELIWSHGQGANVDPLLIKAIIAQESGFRPQAQRAEPRINDASRGLMQILLATARSLGYSGSPDGLFDPDMNLTYGTAYLSQQLMRYDGDMLSAAAAYNAGTARKNADGTFVNQSYVNGVERYYLGYLNQQTDRGGGTLGTADVLRDRGISPDGSGGSLLQTILNLFSPIDATTPEASAEATWPTDGIASDSMVDTGSGWRSIDGESSLLEESTDFSWAIGGAAAIAALALILGRR